MNFTILTSRDIGVYIRVVRKTERLLYILSLLRTNHGLKASDLARKCGVTERSIYRDIISISAANIPIYFDGGYRLLHNGFLPPSNLTEHEAGFLLGLLKSPLLGKGKPFQKTARVIIDKIESMSASDNIKDSISIGAAFTEKQDTYKIAPIIENAIRDRKSLLIHYSSLRGEETERKLDPYAITFRRHAWYIVGYCHLRREIRTFRLGRINKVQIAGKKFEIPTEFSIESYFRSSWGVYKGKIKQFKVKFTGEAAVVIKSSSHHPDETIEDRDNGDVHYKVTVGGEDEFIRWVLGFGDSAEILEPPSARQRARELLGSALSKYE